MTPEEKSEIEAIRGRVTDGCRKLLDLMHYELDAHFDKTGQPVKEMTEATCKRAKIVFDQVRREVGHNKPPAELGEASPAGEPMPGADEAEGKKSRLSKFRIVTGDADSKTG